MPDAAHFLDWIAIFAVIAALVAAAITDAATYLIPHRYPAAVALAFAFYAIGKPAPVWYYGAASAALLLAVGILLFDRGILGGGDVKLLAAAALWAGFDQLPLMLMVTSLAGGALALAHLSPLGRLMPARPGTPAQADLRNRLQQPIPFGVAIATGGVAVALARFAS
ncbi:MAG TPA: prepilin peptidase [Stellaceae bacterium]|jgi:prepilin peptidase CpaA|nr:prepilin peptidase [Stellaceae bacterium]